MRFTSSLRMQSLALLVGSLLLMLVIAITSVLTLGVELRNYRTLMEGPVASADLISEANLAFKEQVQEWKNVLLRGADPADLDRYWRQFQTSEAEVQQLLGQVSELDVSAEVQRQITTLRSTHQQLSERYREGLEHFIATGHDPVAGDTLLRGIDRATVDRLQPLSDQLQQAVGSGGGVQPQRLSDLPLIQQNRGCLVDRVSTPVKTVSVPFKSLVLRLLQQFRDAFGRLLPLLVSMCTRPHRHRHEHQGCRDCEGPRCTGSRSADSRGACSHRANLGRSYAPGHGNERRVGHESRRVTQSAVHAVRHRPRRHRLDESAAHLRGELGGHDHSIEDLTARVDVYLRRRSSHSSRNKLGELRRQRAARVQDDSALCVAAALNPVHLQGG